MEDSASSYRNFPSFALKLFCTSDYLLPTGLRPALPCFLFILRTYRRICITFDYDEIILPRNVHRFPLARPSHGSLRATLPEWL